MVSFLSYSLVRTIISHPVCKSKRYMPYLSMRGVSKNLGSCFKTSISCYVKEHTNPTSIDLLLCFFVFRAFNVG